VEIQRIRRITAILIFISSMSFGLDIKVQCKNGGLESFSISKNSESEDICEIFKTHQLECFDTSKLAKDSHLMSFTLPVDSIYRNRSSESVSKLDIDELVELSLLNKMDPYLVGAIKFVEHPPTSSSKRAELDSSSYQRIYGRLPIDASGAVAAMNCFVKDGKLQKKTKTPNMINLPKGNELGKICILNDNPDTADNPVLTFLDKDSKIFNEQDAPLRNNGVSSGDVYSYMEKIGEKDFFKAKEKFLLEISLGKFRSSGSCCIDVRYDSKSDYGKTISQVKSTLALIHLRDKTKTIPKRVNVAGKSKDELVALKIQGYNGYGVFGSTESVGNSCLKGIKMGDRPVYGAGTMDLAINMFLLNTRFNEVVREKKKSLGIESTPFLLCENRDGVAEINSLSFAQLQKTYLESQKSCPSRTFDYFRKEKGIKKVKGEKVNRPASK